MYRSSQHMDFLTLALHISAAEQDIKVLNMIYFHILRALNMIYIYILRILLS